MSSDLQQARAKAPVHSNVAKLALRFTLLMGSIAVIAIAAYLASQNNTVPLGIIGPISIVVFIWSLFEVMYMAIHRGGLSSVACLIFDCIVIFGQTCSIVALGCFEPWWLGNGSLSNGFQKGAMIAMIAVSSIMELILIVFSAVACYRLWIGRDDEDEIPEHKKEVAEA